MAEGWREAAAAPYLEESERLAALLAAGRLDPREWAEALARAIVKGHAASWAWARASNGLPPSDEEAELTGRARLDAEAPYLRRFLDQVAAGWGEGDQAVAVARRAASYAGAMRGTATEGFFSLAPPGEEYRWVLGAEEDHCPECPRLAAAGAWKPDELYVWPGSNDTPCLFNCKCFLVRVADGARSPAPL